MYDCSDPRWSAVGQLLVGVGLAATAILPFCVMGESETPIEDLAAIIADVSAGLGSQAGAWLLTALLIATPVVGLAFVATAVRRLFRHP